MLVFITFARKVAVTSGFIAMMLAVQGSAVQAQVSVLTQHNDTFGMV
jgi:hypothetical protein